MTEGKPCEILREDNHLQARKEAPEESNPEDTLILALGDLCQILTYLQKCKIINLCCLRH